MTLDASTLSYVPDDAGITLESLDFLFSPAGVELRAAVLRLLATTPNPGVADVAQLRKAYPTFAVNAALTMGELQSKAHSKFPPDPADSSTLRWIWCIPEALEQASSYRVAQHKAARFAALRPTEIADLCAGIGGDSLALAEVAPTLAVDLSAPRLRCADLNANSLPTGPLPHPLRTQTAQVSTLLDALPPETPIHIDPARRSAGKRSIAWSDLIPGPSLLDPLRARFRAVAIKLSPAVDFAALPPGHVELISEKRSVVQAILWSGDFTSTLPIDQRTATLLHADHPPYSLTARPDQVRLDASLASTVFELDGAFTRAGLAAAFAELHNLSALTVDGGYLTGNITTPLPATHAFTVIDSFAYSEKRVLEALRAHASAAPAGPVEVKTRGGLDLDTDQLQRTWSKKAPVALTVLIHRDDRSNRRAILARRIP